MTLARNVLPAEAPVRAVPGSEAVFGHLLRISRAMAGHLDFQAAIQAVSAELGDVLPHDHLDICLLGSEGTIHAAYEAGLHTDWSLNPHPVPVSGSPIRSILQGETLVMRTGDATLDPRFRFEGAFNHPIFDQNLRSRIHTALLVRGEVIGAFSCSKHDADFYGEGDAALARHVADLLAPYFYALRASQETRRLAIEEAEGRAREEGLREGALRLTEELERERQRIGMDLHDQTLADLTRIVRRLEALREGPVDPDSLSPAIVGCIAASTSCGGSSTMLARTSSNSSVSLRVSRTFSGGHSATAGSSGGSRTRAADVWIRSIRRSVSPCFASCRRRSTTPRATPTRRGSRSEWEPPATRPCRSRCATTGWALRRCRSGAASAASATCRRARG